MAWLAKTLRQGAWQESGSVFFSDFKLYEADKRWGGLEGGITYEEA